MRYIKTDWYQWHDTHASLLVQVDWHRLLVLEKWSVCMALMSSLPKTCNWLCKYADDIDLIIPPTSVKTRSADLENIEMWAQANKLTLTQAMSVKIVLADSR